MPRISKYHLELTAEDVARNRDEIISLLRETHREHVDEVVEFLD